jgi:hypothetical protein
MKLFALYRLVFPKNNIQKISLIIFLIIILLCIGFYIKYCIIQKFTTKFEDWFILGKILDLDKSKYKYRLIYISKDADYYKVKLNYTNKTKSGKVSGKVSGSSTFTKEELQTLENFTKSEKSLLYKYFQFPHSLIYDNKNYYVLYYYEVLKTENTGSFGEIEFLDNNNNIIYKHIFINELPKL